MIEPYNNIRIDNFTIIKKKGGKKKQAEVGETIFICSHMHEDHIKGLVGDPYQGKGHSPNVEWNLGKIYCT